MNTLKLRAASLAFATIPGLALVVLVAFVGRVA